MYKVQDPDDLRTELLIASQESHRGLRVTDRLTKLVQKHFKESLEKEKTEQADVAER